ncbi:MAG: phospholipid scramblase-related protein [Pseudobdellovibrionaceae bacterium]
MSSSSDVSLSGFQKILVHQVHELGEWLGFETRNKYAIMDENKRQIAFAAEQQKGIFGFLLRQYLGHWRKFDVHFFTPERQVFMVGHHPFRWFFERIELRDGQGKYLGAIQKRFSLLTKRFDVENERGMTIMEVASPIWKIWTFTFKSKGKKIAEVKKKWAGIFAEGFTDKDNFMVEFADPSLSESERKVVMASAVFVDLLYFEKKR